jgi:hypothetical protein
MCVCVELEFPLVTITFSRIIIPPTDITLWLSREHQEPAQTQV